jgi:hypothetical protein
MIPTTDTLLGIAIAFAAGALTWLCYELVALERERRRQRRAAEKLWAERSARRHARR